MEVKKYIGWIFISISLTLFIPQQLLAQQKYTAQSYIQANKDAAIKYMKEYGIPASIILGIAYHESAHGNSKLATYLNNHFGIKGKNNSTKIKSAYKGYDSVEDSYFDFVNLIESRKQFNVLIDKYGPGNYKDWVFGIARGGYAASSKWASQVIAIIDKHKLYELDENPASQSNVQLADSQNNYTVKKGDSLSELARRFQTTVSDIKDKNKLTSSNLQIGQELML
ncbi:glucosaminidase domain and LysM peptidoglycan-binding domain-containing protein [Albibacterium bauzanense]|uniref:Peptidoglycan hydrolase n=1 Tax=Albibacterium bauzanense TaxID=653929 RepID=A0A4R1LUY7_9SPHI|nr:glucosaminidase domain-containing protein [Albibacterium bauzanense]TCK83186.1 flagellum-specific peptidoglycan hydrolase FlgJ [Albibacterium bauzanense]